MIMFTYDTPRPRSGTVPEPPEQIDDLPNLPQPLPEEEPGEWGDPIMVEVDDDSERPGGDDYPADTPQEEDEPGVAVDEDEVPPARGPESEPP